MNIPKHQPAMIIKFIIFGMVFISAELFSAQTLANDQASDRIISSDQILRMNPDDLDALFAKAQALESIGKLNAAIELYEKVIIIAPNLSEAYNNLAILQVQQSEFQSAIVTLEKGINQHDKMAILYGNITSIYSELASQAYRKALAIEPQTAIPPKLVSFASLPQADGVSVAMERVDVDNKQLPESVLASNNQATKTQDEAFGSQSIEQALVSKIDLSQEQSNHSADNTSNSSIDVSIADLNQTKPGNYVATNEIMLKETKRTVMDWVKTWSDQSVDQYLSYYAADFKPQDNLSLANWKKQRFDRLTRPKFIVLELSDITQEVVNNNATVTFVQHYRSNTFENIVRKTLTLRKINAQWKIIKENT